MAAWRRRILRALLGTGLVVLGVALVVSIAAAVLWNRTTARLEAESGLARTERGPVEYASVGSGDPVLLIHGAPGGYDQLLPLARALAGRGFRAVTVSRPGYLRTPQQVGTTATEQAEALAALLDALDIEAAHVIGLSGGGPVTFRLVRDHRDRVRRLVLVAAASLPLLQETELESVKPFTLVWDLGALAAQTFPSLGLRMLGVTGERARAFRSREASLASLRYLFQSMGFSGRRRGYAADLRMLTRPGLAEGDIPPGVPTLILHGEKDENVPLAHAETSARLIPGAELRVFDGGTHAFFVIEDAWVEEQIAGFLGS